MNLAKIIYEAYPGSDLLPIDPAIHLRDLDTLRDYLEVHNVGDSLFSFIVFEVYETMELADITSALKALRTASDDLSSVIEALERTNNGT